MIPADRFDPLAANFVNLYPNPNQDGLKNNYLVNPRSTNSINQGDLRVDHQFSPDNRLFVRLSLTKGDRFLQPPLPGLANGGDYGTGTSNSKTWGAAVGFTHVFSPTMVNELRVGFNRVKGSDGITVGGQQAPPPELTVPGVANDPAVAGITVFDPAGYSHVGDPEFIPTYTLSQELQLSDTLSLVRGSHSIKTGFQLRRSYFDLFQIPQPRGKFSFSGEFTQDPDHNDGTGDPLADALLGYSSQIDISNITQTKNRTPVVGAFFQDDFKVTPSLTLNLGLRWDYTGPTVEADDRQSNFDYATGQVLVANQDGNSRGLIDVDKFDFAPRLGFAWSPFKDGKTAFRGGYGIFYGAQEVRTGFQLGYSMPFFFALSKSSEFGVTPAAYVTQGFPALDPTAASFPGILSADLRFKSPYYQQWNVSVQRDIGWNTLLEVAYVGSKGTHLQVLRDYNQPQPGPGDPQERRPYPQYGQLRVDHQRGHLDLQLPPAQTQQAVEQRLLAAHCIHLWQGVQRPARDLLRVAVASRQLQHPRRARPGRLRPALSLRHELRVGSAVRHGAPFPRHGGRRRRDFRWLAGWWDRDDYRRVPVFAGHQPRHVEHRHVRPASARPDRQSQCF